MTDREKQIAEMADIMFENRCGADCVKCNMNGKGLKCVSLHNAELLYNAGYGNVKEYQDEIDRLEMELAHREQDLVHADEAVSYRESAVRLAEDKIKKQAVKEFAEKLRERMEKNGYRSALHNGIIDDLYEELYVSDEKRAQKIYEADDSFDCGYHTYAKEKHEARVEKNPDRLEYATRLLQKHGIEFAVKNAQTCHIHAWRKRDGQLMQFWAGTGKIFNSNKRGIENFIKLLEQ